MKRLIMIYLFLCVSASMLFAQLSNTGIVPSVEWQHCLGGSGSDKVISAHTTLDKSNVIFGNSNSTSGDVVGNHGGYDIWVVSVDSMGVIQWQVCLGGSADEELHKVFPLANGHYRLLASTLSNNGNVSGNHGGKDAWVVEIDAVGNLVSQLCLGGTGTEIMKDAFMNNGEMIILGTTTSNDGDVSGNHGGLDRWAVTLDAGGNLVQQTCIGGSGDDGLLQALIDNDGNYVIGGFSTSIDGDNAGNWYGQNNGNIGMGPYWLVSLNSNLALQWSTMPDTAFFNPPSSFAGYTPYQDYLAVVPGGGFWMVYINEYSPITGLPVYYFLKLSATGTLVSTHYRILEDYVINSYTIFVSQKYIITNTGGLIAYSQTYHSNTCACQYEYHSYDEFDANGNVIYDCYTEIGTNPQNQFYTQTGTCPPSGGDNGIAGMGINPTPFMGSPAPLFTYNPNSFYQYVPTTAEGGYTYTGETNHKITSTHPQNGTWSKSLGGTLVHLASLHGTLTSVATTPSTNANAVGAHGNEEYWVINSGNPNNVFEGIVWVDANTNNVLDAGEATENIIVQTVLSTNGVNPTANFYLGTNNNGEYSMRVGATHIMVDIPYPPLYHSVSPLQYIDSFSQINVVNSSNDFKLIPTPNIHDLRVSVVNLNDPNPGFNTPYQITYKNVGTTIQTGYIRYDLDPTMTYVSANPAPDSIAPDHLSWNFSNLQALHSGNISMVLHTNVAATGTLHTTTKVYPIMGDFTPQDNQSTDDIPILGSFDPNDMQVSTHQIDTTFVQNNEYLTYTIRFQNTGTDSAANVVVKSIFSSKVSLASIDILGASHLFELESQNDTLRFMFPNIMLPDSNTSEINSHGFVKFRVRVSQNWLACDTLRAYSDIFFDFNPPVRTNKAKTMLEYPKPVVFANMPLNFCQGSILTLTAYNTNVGSYLWSTNTTTQSINVGTPTGFKKRWVTTTANIGECITTSDTVYINVYPSPGVPAITFTGNDTLCEGNSVVLVAPNSANYTYSWSDGTTTRKDTITQSGIYDVTVTNQYGCSKTSTTPVSINFLPAPPVPVISANQNILTSNAANNIQWFFNGNIINGATSTTYNATQSGIYTTTVTNGNGCSSTSAPYTFIYTGIDDNLAQWNITCFPNPAQDILYINGENETSSNINIDLIDATGKSVFSQKQEKTKRISTQIPVSRLSKGVYLLKIATEKGYMTKQITIGS